MAILRGVVSMNRAFEAMGELARLREPELVLLKGHLAVERFLISALAARLRVSESEVPRLSFGPLVDLVYSDGPERRELIWVNDLRNALAHQFDALDTQYFRDIVKRFELRWPEGTLERCIVLEQLVLRSAQAILLREIYLRLAETSDVELTSMLESLRDSATDFLHDIDENLDTIRSGNWEDLIRRLRPGWRPRAENSSV